jgi:hypothetical protein
MSDEAVKMISHEDLKAKLFKDPKAEIAYLKAKVERLEHEFARAAGYAEALEAEVERLRADHAKACKVVADMHDATVGELRGPTIGVLGDVVALRTKVARIEGDYQEARDARDAERRRVAGLEAEVQRGRLEGCHHYDPIANDRWCSRPTYCSDNGQPPVILPTPRGVTLLSPRELLLCDKGRAALAALAETDTTIKGGS